MSSYEPLLQRTRSEPASGVKPAAGATPSTVRGSTGPARHFQHSLERISLIPAETKSDAVTQRVAWHNLAVATNQVRAAGPVFSANLINNNATTNISVSGLAFTGPQYDVAATNGNNKTAAVTGIAAKIAQVDPPPSNKFLSRAQLNRTGIAATIPDPTTIDDGNFRNIYKGFIDPFIIKAPGTYDVDGVAKDINLYYQYGVDSYGYIVKIDQEGQSHAIHAERGQAALERAQQAELESGRTLDNELFRRFSSAHDTVVPDESIAAVAAGTTADLHIAESDTTRGLLALPGGTENLMGTLKEKSKKLDAVTKIAGEGARWQCVRNHAAQLRNDSKFYTTDPDDGTQKLYMTFQKLWGVWATKFASKFNIADAEVRNVIIANENDNDLTARTANVTGADYSLD